MVCIEGWSKEVQGGEGEGGWGLIIATGCLQMENTKVDGAGSEYCNRAPGAVQVSSFSPSRHRPAQPCLISKPGQNCCLFRDTQKTSHLESSGVWDVCLNSNVLRCLEYASV